MIYIELYIYGIFSVEKIIHKVKNRQVPNNLSEQVIAYRFFERDEVTVNNRKIIGESHNFSPMTYFGRIFTLGELRTVPHTKVLQDQMLEKHWNKVVCNKFGKFQPLEEDAIVINC